MNKLSFFFLTFFIVFAATHAALAQTYYDILERQYGLANAPISESDIDIPGHPLARLCVEIDIDKPMKENYVMIHKYKRILEGQGPLLPRVELTKVLYRPYTGDAFFDQSFETTETEFLAKEIRSTLTDAEGKKRWTLSVRKKDDILLFRRDAFIDPAKTTYGYCYHRNGVKKELSHELF